MQESPDRTELAISRRSTVRTPHKAERMRQLKSRMMQKRSIELFDDEVLQISNSQEQRPVVRRAKTAAGMNRPVSVATQGL